MCRRTASWLLVSALCVVPRAARADVAATECPESTPTACGRYQFEAGTAAFERADYSAAVARFQAAMAQRPHPVIRFNLALALLRLGQPSAAIVELVQVVKDPEADKGLKERAERERRAAERAQARVYFKLSDPARERVELDGGAVDLSAAQELTLDPGSHHVRVISKGSVVLDQELELAAGERVELRVGERSRRIDVVVVPEPAAAPLVPPAPLPAAPPERAGLSPAWFYAGVGATAVLTGFTVWSAIDTQRAYSDYRRDLPGLTQAQADERVESGHGRELRTNLLLTGSLLCGAGSAVLGIWFVDFGGSRRTALAVSPSGVAVSGRF